MTEIKKLSEDAAQIIAAAMGVRAKDILSKSRGGWEVSDSRFILYAVMAEEGYEYRTTHIIIIFLAVAACTVIVCCVVCQT